MQRRIVPLDRGTRVIEQSESTRLIARETKARQNEKKIRERENPRKNERVGTTSERTRNKGGDCRLAGLPIRAYDDSTEIS